MNHPPRKTTPLMLAALALALAFTARGQFAPTGPNVAHSVSGQFVIHAQRPGPMPAAASDLIQAGKLVALEPSLVAVSSERIKDALTEELGPGGPWRGKIYFSLQPARTSEDGITIIGERFKSGWGYRLNVPNPVEPVRYVRAVVQAILQERVNRGAQRAAELPQWLIEGLVQNILAGGGPQVLLAVPQLQGRRLAIQPTLTETLRTNAATLARSALGEREPLTLEQLSWPGENQLAGPDAEVYRLSAQLFVAELLRLPEGRACLQAMLGELPRCYNWQTAFLRGFRPHFEQQLDVEKWWTLQLVHTAGRGPGAAWSDADSWAKLDEILQVPAEVRQTRTNLPAATRVPLGAVIGEWDFARQAPALQLKLTELTLARSHLAAEFLPLVDNYRRLLSNYLRQRDQAGNNLSAGKANTPTAYGVTRDTLRQLNGLEQLRAKARPAPPATAHVDGRGR